MTRKSFKTSYIELYLINPEIYRKVIDNISDQIDKDDTMNLNKPDDILEEDFDNVQSNTEIPGNDNVNQSNDKLEKEEDLSSKMEEIKNLIHKKNMNQSESDKIPLQEVKSVNDMSTQFDPKELNNGNVSTLQNPSQK